MRREHQSSVVAVTRTLQRSGGTFVPFCEYAMTLFCSHALILRSLMICILITTTSTFAADQVTRISDGETIRGEFKTLSKTQIVITRSNDQSETISPANIYDIRFHREPPPLQTARSSERNGSYKAAIGQLQEVKAEYAGSDRRVPIEIDFLTARCHARRALSNPEETAVALESLQLFAQQHAENYRTLEARLLQAQLLIEFDRVQGRKLLKQLRNCRVEGFEVQAGLILGHALLEEDQVDQAMQIFYVVTGKSAENPTLQILHYDSRIGRAECFQRQNRWPQALETLKAVIAEVPEDEEPILAKAWNDMGDCYRLSNQPQGALMAYLHVDILYSNVPVEHAEALHRLGALWEDTGHPDRSHDARSRLQAQYPQSPWVRQVSN
ncbi:MAG: tetratricopeptide repeat protein [Fuerstiella sp.]|nr:tetratricopeptide repeat protein [Fuerstiella sp.]